MSRTQLTSGQLLDGGIKTADIGDLQVTDAKLSLTGVTAGDFAQVSVNAQGRVTGGSPTLPWSKISGTPSILPNLSLTATVAAASSTSLIPFDNTTPLSTEGTQIATVTCTPSDPASKLAFQGALNIDCGTSNRNFTIAIFRGTTCIGVQTMNFVTSGRPQVFSFFIVDDQIGATTYGSSATYSIRMGINSAATWYVNRQATVVFNGLLAANDILIWEYV